MATLENIRKRGPLVALVIGFALLAFILGDFLNSSSSLFTGDKFEIVNINGESVNYQEYQARVDEAETIYKLSTGKPLGEGVGEQIRAQVWETIIQKNLLGDQYDELGLGVHPDEVFELVNTGKGLSPGLRQAFTNPETGVFDKNAIMNFLKNMDKDPNAKAIWMYHEKDMIQTRTLQKYANLIAKGLYVTNAQAEQELKDRSKMVDLEFVAQSYAQVPDSAVKVSNSDIEAYYNTHQYLYQQEQGRDVAYVTFDIKASKEDVAEAEKNIHDIVSEFATIKSENLEKYVNANSDKRFNSTHYKKGELPNYELDSVMFQSEEGAIYGPYREGDFFKVARLVKRVMLADSIKARHILITPNKDRTMADAHALIDSLKGQIEKGIDFDAVAKEYSDDKSNSDKGGDLDWFTEGSMVKEFNDACFNAKKGDLFAVETSYGVHLVRIDDETAPIEKVQVALIEYEITASEKTIDQMYAKASNFVVDNNTAEKFDAALAKEGLIKKMASNLTPGQNKIPGLESPREMIKWAYNADLKDVSPVFDFGNRFAVGVLTSVREKGTAKFEQVEQEVTLAVKKEKKAEMLAAKMKGKQDLAGLAADLNATVLSAQNISFSSFQIPGAGAEPEIIGEALKMEKGAVSEPITGNNGVYVVKVVELTDPKMENPDLSIDRTRVERNLQSRANYELYNSLKRSANIVDGRTKFF